MLILQPSCQSETFSKLLRLGLKYRTLDPVRALIEPIDGGLIYYYIPTIIVDVGGVGGMQMQRLKIISKYGVGGKFLNKASFL